MSNLYMIWFAVSRGALMGLVAALLYFTVIVLFSL